MKRSPQQRTRRLGTQVQVWSSVSPFAWVSSKRSPPTSNDVPVRVRLVRVAVVGRPLEPLDLELPLVDRRVVARGEHVALEALRHVLVRDHVRLAAPLGLEERDAEDVIDVPVRVDRGVERSLGPRPDLLVHRLGDEDPAGVDQHEAVVGLERADVRERRQERRALGDLDELPGEPHRVVLLDRLTTRPQGVREPEHIGPVSRDLSPHCREAGSLSDRGGSIRQLKGDGPLSFTRRACTR